MGRCIWLPLRKEATFLFENFAAEVDYISRILHLPTVRTRLDELYVGLAHGNDPNLGIIALFLSIFASSAYFWTLSSCIGQLFPGIREATQGALQWSKAALDVMNHLDRTMSGGIEDVQARIILILLVYNFERFSTVTRSLHTSALTIAQTMYFHRTDCNSRGDMERSQESVIETEIK